jgi:tetratricopeptide (TPR) repeat protein
MSIILDALRRGRGKQPPQGHANAAQTDAVLETLGYGRTTAPSRLSRLKRLFGFVIVSVAASVLLWFVVVWITQAYLAGGLTRPDPAGSPPPAQPARTTRPSQRVENAPVGPSPPAPVALPASSAPFDPPHLDANVLPRAAEQRPPHAAVQRSNRPDVRDPVPAPGGSGPATDAMSRGAPPATVRRSENDFDKAVYYQRMGDFESALFHYKQLLKRDELNADAHNNLGLLYRDKGLPGEAINEFRRAIAINPRKVRPRNNLGVVYLSQRKLDAAAAEFHTALAIDPRNVESLVNLSIVEREAGRRDEARRALVRALDVDPKNVEAHYNLALLDDEAGNKDAALLHYRIFLQQAASHAALAGDVRKRMQQLEGEQ